MGHPCTIVSFLTFLTCVFHFIDFFIFFLFRIKSKMLLTCTYFSLRCGATNVTPQIHFSVPYIFSPDVTHHMSRLCASLYHDEPKVWLYLYSCIVLDHA
jgi:hypothetical protein